MCSGEAFVSGGASEGQVPMQGQGGQEPQGRHLPAKSERGWLRLTLLGIREDVGGGGVGEGSIEVFKALSKSEEMTLRNKAKSDVPLYTAVRVVHGARTPHLPEFV